MRASANQIDIKNKKNRLDILTQKQRSYCMSRIKAKNTKPEMAVRKTIHSLGFRYQLHNKNLPGKPDMVFPRYHAVIFVHGCFWHNHSCKYSGIPLTRRIWWQQKLEGNRKHDAKVLLDLHNMAWLTLVIWQCSFRCSGKAQKTSLKKVAMNAARFLCSHKHHHEIAGSQYNDTSTKKASH